MKHSNLARRALNERKLVFLLIKKFPHPFKVGDKKRISKEDGYYGLESTAAAAKDEQDRQDTATSTIIIIA